MTSLPTAFLTNGITAGLTLIESLPDRSTFHSIIIKLLKPNTKEKSEKVPERSDIAYRKLQFEWQWISHLKAWSKEGRGTFFRC